MRMWRRTPAGSLLSRRWDSVAAVFDLNTGDTHMLDALASEVLNLVTASPVTAEELSGRLGTDLDLPADSALVETVRQTLERFVVLGLVEEMAT